MNKNIVIVDYGMGNVQNVYNAFKNIGACPEISNDADTIKKAHAVVLPGVGAFGDCVSYLAQSGLDKVVCDVMDSNTPFLGICLGLQTLFERSEESKGQGLGVFAGSVDRFKIDQHVPHMGWNAVNLTPKGQKCPLMDGIDDGSYFYFVHSYFVNPANDEIIAGTTNYGINFTSMVWMDNVFATQFHPEKSQDKGMALLKNFLKIT